MHIVIAGGGIVGRQLTRHFSKDHDVVVIDQDKTLCEKLAANYGAVAICGDATNIKTLEEAGIYKADYALGVMRYDKDNLLFSLLSKKYNVKQIFVRMRDPDYRDAYTLAGATNIAHTVNMMVEKFIHDIDNPEIKRVARISKGKAEISIIRLPESSHHLGKSIQDIVKEKAFPKDIVIAGIFDHSSDELVIPKGSTILSANVDIFLVGSSENIAKAYKVLRK